ncbi:MAG: hypothetical protein JNK15_11395 [Planctomycetes bacterium]|nr:hypothetical protein [Planctomycetota bacterium]
MNSLAGAWLVPVPVVAWYVLRALGLPVGAAEDVVTLLVMVPLGGPHVVATLERTVFAAEFWREHRAQAAAAALVLVGTAVCAVTSVFLGARIAGAPPMAWLLTFFFFWAGLHVVQQHGYVARRMAAAESGVRPATIWSEQLLLALSLYPVSLFRMSMAEGGANGGGAADPAALATVIVRALGGSSAFADDYVFRIGRNAPILPDWARHPALWIAVTVAFLLAAVVFAAAALRDHRAGRPFGRRRALVTTVASTCFLVPLLPNLDSAFQGVNAWHSLQYLALSRVLQHDASCARGDGAHPAVTLESPLRTWLRGLGLTLVLVGVMLGAAFVIEVASGGAFVMFGHDVPPRDASGQPLYRPGSVLLAYWLVGFGFLLVHYLLDSLHFVRPPARTITAG